jgi:hypothetical protein
MSFEECCKRIQKVFDFEISIPTPYKLCDYKPSYFLIFNDLLKGCDFFGWGDLDLILGNIREFVTEEVLEKYDVISGWGHLTLLRNTEYWTTFFMKEVEGFKSYKDVYQDPRNFGFDEYWHKGIADKAKFLHPEKVWNPMLFDDLRTPECSIDFKAGNRRLFESLNLMYEYNNGRMYRIHLLGENMFKESTMYMHFKRRLNMLKVCTEPSNHYLIIPNKIIPYEEITLQKVYKWTSINPFTRLLVSLQLQYKAVKKRLLHT